MTFSYTFIQLGLVCRYARTARLAVMFPRLNASLPEAEVDTPRRGAMYLAQLAHKSEEFRVMEEIWGLTAQQASYEGRADLGNTQPGDGRRFKGRGVIQIMGRNNYRTAGEALGLPLLLHPELAAQPENAFRVAAWFWKTHGCNASADKEDLDGCTGIVNGGLTGIESRLRYYELAKDVLGVDRLSV